jgi:hypothetical protein
MKIAEIIKATTQISKRVPKITVIVFMVPHNIKHMRKSIRAFLKECVPRFRAAKAVENIIIVLVHQIFGYTNITRENKNISVLGIL